VAVHLLVLSDRPGGGRALLPSLEYLDHTIQDVGLEDGLMQSLGTCDLVVVDGTGDLRRAAAACRSLSLNELGRPVCLVMGEGGLAALKLSWGFDEWLLPGASPVELETRLRLIVDRAVIDHGQRSASVGDLVVDEDSYQVRLRGRPLDLTFREFELLKALASAPNRVFTRDLLLQEVWGYDYFGGSRTVDVHVRRVRAKLGPEYESMIATVRGVGYKLVPPGQREREDELTDA
jgi:DNA-binding response OmpR family regulator